MGRGGSALLAEAIAVSGLGPVAEEFHARFSATGRTYEYRIRNALERDPLERLREHHVDTALDVAAMREASTALVGRKDFSAFAAGAGGGRTIRRAGGGSDGPPVRLEITAGAVLARTGGAHRVGGTPVR